MQVEVPTFPLTHPPTCRRCGRPGLRPNVRQSNPIGHAGRPYYICSGGHKGDFITFDDNIGIAAGNPPCFCGYASRLSRRRDGDGQFYSCPIGRCHFTLNGPSLSPQVTQIQTGANEMGMEISGSSAEVDGSQGPIIQSVADDDRMDWTRT